ncbi:MAG: hypothetical protein AB7P23_01800 [Amphiplicatus sp.]
MTGTAAPVGADPIAALSNEVEALAALGNARAKRLARFIAGRLKAAVRRWGETVLMEARTGSPPKTASVMIGIRTLRDVDLIGDVKISDYSLIIPADPLIDAGFPQPLEEGVMVWRFPGTGKERGIRIYLEPQALGVEDKILLYRAVGRG